MNKFSNWIVRNRKFILWGYLLASILSILALPFVNINYDNSRYLPKDIKTQQSLTIMKNAFGINGSAQAMIKDVSISEAVEWKAKIAQINGVKNVLWLDDFVDIHQPAMFTEKDILASWYKDRYALMQIIFVEDDYSVRTEETIHEIRMLSPDKIQMRGSSIDAIATRNVASSEVSRILIWIVPIMLLILILSTQSWLEPLLFLVTIGISVLMNMGTNFIFKDISYLTQTVAGVLQLALAMDYSIFLLHRYREERKSEVNPKKAMKKAIVKTFSSISGSSITTIASFVVLMFMRYQIGLDLGLVLVKGIALSLIAVLFLLPSLTLLLDPWLQKTSHRPFLPSMSVVSKGIMKIKGTVAIMILLLVIPAFLAQKSNNFVYGESSASMDQNTPAGQENIAIENVFGYFHPVVLMVPSGQYGQEAMMVDRIQKMDSVLSVESISTLADSAIPRHMLPVQLIQEFEQNGYTKIIVFLNSPTEGPEVFLILNNMKEIASQYFGEEYHMIGTSSGIMDIKEVVEEDFIRIHIASILVIALILLLLFRSFMIPILLVFIIEVAIWINMAIPYFASKPIIFIGYMIVNTVQLGATIDYAILLTSRYKENRKDMEPKEAIKKALINSGTSILSAAMIVAAAGLCLAFVSDISSISSIGQLIGRGAIISSMLVLIVLPQLLLWSDSFFKKSSRTLPKRGQQ